MELYKAMESARPTLTNFMIRQQTSNGNAWLLLTAKLQDVKCLPLLSSATSEAFLAVFQPLKPFSPSLAHSPFPLMKRLIKVM